MAVLAPMAPLSALRRRRVSSSFSPGDLANLVAHWPAASAGTGIATSTPNANPGTMANATWDTDKPTALAALNGSLAFGGAVAPAQRVVLGSSVGTPSMTRLGQGENILGPGAAISVWVKRTGTGATTQSLLVTAADASKGLCIHSGALSWHDSTFTDAPSTLSTGTWHHCVFVAHANQYFDLWVDGVRVKRWVPANVFAVTMGAWGGIASSETTCLLGNLCDGRFYNRELQEADITALFAGGEAAIEPAGRWRFDEGTGTAVADSARTVSSYGSAVTTLNDTSGAAKHLTGTALYRQASPLHSLPLIGMGECVRFDYPTSHNLKRSAVLGSAVTECTLALAGRLSDPWHSTTSFLPFYFAGASNDGAFPQSGTGSSSGLALGYYYGGPAQASGSGGVSKAHGWYAYAKGAGLAPIFAKSAHGTPFDCLPHTFILTYKASTYLRIYLDGVKVAEQLTSVPATLNLSGNTELGSLNAGASYASGWDHLDGWLYTTAHDTHAGALHNWLTGGSGPGLTAYPVTWQIVYGGPTGWDGSSALGFNHEASVIKSNVSGDYLCAWNRGFSDPSPFDLMVARRAAADGSAWQTPVTLADGSTNTGHYTNDSLQQKADGTLHLHSIHTPYPYISGDWVKDRRVSTDDGANWGAPSTFSFPAGYANEGQLRGKWLEQANGDIWATFYPKYTANGKYHSVVLISTDGGATWTLKTDISLEDTAPDSGIDLTESSILKIDANNYLHVARFQAGFCPLLNWSTDGAATWERGVHFGANAQPNAIAAPALWLCVDGSVLMFLTQRGASSLTATARPGIVVYRSRDKGRTWGPATVLLADASGFGYPSVCRTTGMRIMVAFSNELVDMCAVEIDERAPAG